MKSGLCQAMKIGRNERTVEKRRKTGSQAISPADRDKGGSRVALGDVSRAPRPTTGRSHSVHAGPSHCRNRDQRQGSVFSCGACTVGNQTESEVRLGVREGRASTVSHRAAEPRAGETHMRKNARLLAVALLFVFATSFAAGVIDEVAGPRVNTEQALGFSFGSLACIVVAIVVMRWRTSRDG